MNLRMKTALLIMMTFTTLFASNNSESINTSDEDVYLKIVDSREREVLLHSEPQRIISLAPSITETIYALDSGNKLVGRTDYCNYPTKVQSVKTIGTLYEPNIEKIIELNPDIIIASSHFRKDLLSKLEDLGINVIIIDEYNTIDGVYRNIIEIGEILNKKEEATQLISSIDQRIKDIKQQVKDLTRPTVYYVIGYGEYGDYTAGGDTYISALIEAAGGNNIAKDSKGWSYSLEKIIEKNPEMLICSKYYDTKAGISQATGYKDLPSVLNGHIYTIDNNLIDRQGPRIAEALEALVQVIHRGQL